MALVGHVDANRHALLNTRKLPVYSTCRLCMHNGLCSRWDGGRVYSDLKLQPLARGVNPNRKS
jgi:hypothetical protein